MPKATRTVIVARIDDVLRLRLAGAEFSDIRQYAAGDPQDDPPRESWNVSDRTLKRYIEAADKQLCRRMERDRDKLFARHIGQRRMLFVRALEQGDNATAGRMLDAEERLLARFGIFPDKPMTGNGSRMQINVWEIKLQRLSHEELQTIRKLAEKMNGDASNGTNGNESSPAGVDLSRGVPPLVPLLRGELLDSE